MRSVLAAAVILLFGAVTFGLIARPSKTDSHVTAPLSGHQAPDFAVANVHGRTVSLSSQRGKVVLVNFWATWCAPCTREMPAISEVYRAHARSLVVLAIDKQEPVSDVIAFAHEHQLAFAPLIDTDGAIFSRYRVSHVQPVSFWIDRGGIVRFVFYGEMSHSDLQRALAALGLS